MTTAAAKKFDLGMVSATPAAIKLAQEQGLDLPVLLRKHASGDWGEIDAEDARANEQSLKSGQRVMSVWGSPKLWIITDGLTDACPFCWAGLGTCEPGKGSHAAGLHFRDDLPPRRLTTTILTPDDY